MKVAQYKNLGLDFVCIDEKGSLDECNGYIRVSEYADVEFAPRAADETVPQEVAALEKAKANAAAKYHEIAASIDDKISKLLAITHEVSE